MIKVVIIDDEPAAVKLLSRLLKYFPEVDIVATAFDADSAYEVILKYKPDLIFLDIQLPRESGIEICEKINTFSKHPAIIFVTAYDKFAIPAIKHAAFDYLLKPVDRNELKEAIFRFKLSQNKLSLEEKLNRLYANLHHRRKLRFNTRSGFFMVDPSEIIYCEADGNYTKIHIISGKEEITTLNLTHLKQLLPPSLFYRISRFHIVNLQFVTRVDRKTRNCEIGINGIIYKLTIPRKNLKELENRLMEVS